MTASPAQILPSTMTTGHPLSRPFERNTRVFGSTLPAAMQGEVKALHDCRVATRRLREALPLCASEVSRATADRARRRLRRVGRALGPVREFDVSLELLDELMHKGFVEGEASERLREHLDAERDERREQMLDRLRAVNSRKLERDLADIARSLTMRQQTDAWALTLARRINRRADRLRDAIGVAGPLYIADRVHAVRIAAKKLRYSLEFAVETKEARAKRVVGQVKEVQDTLGRLHDLDVLTNMMQDLAIPNADAPWSGDLETLRLRLERECRRLHGRYVARQARLLEICDVAARISAQIATERGGVALASGVRPIGRVLKMRLGDETPTDQKATGGR